jgi:hypothetical protein
MAGVLIGCRDGNGCLLVTMMVRTRGFRLSIGLNANQCSQASFQTLHSSAPCMATLISHCHATGESLSRAQDCATNSKGYTVHFYRGPGLWFGLNSV